MEFERPGSARHWLTQLFNGIAVFTLVISVLHMSAWLATPRGLGFNPHPWFLAAPDGLRDLLQSIGFPTTNLGVVSTFFLFLPIYLLTMGVFRWLAIRLSTSRRVEPIDK